MRLSSKCQKLDAVSREMQQTHPLRDLYQNVLTDLADMKNKLSFTTLWRRLSPSGNIYRFNCLQQSRLAHCADLGEQLDDLAEHYAPILGGALVPIEERTDLLMKALKTTQVKLALVGHNAKADAEMGVEETTGFPPLQEFLEEKTYSGCFWHSPEDPESHQAWHRANSLGLMVAWIQALGPMLIFMNQWDSSTNYFRDPQALWARLRWDDIVCLERTVNDWATLTMGTLFMYMVVTQLMHYAESELASVKKNSHLEPQDSIWSWLGNSAQLWCILVNATSLPIAFWMIKSASQVVLGALGVIFLLKLDDLDGPAGSLLRVNDEQFQRAMCWHYSLLSHCPVRVLDLVNPDATSEKDFWQISIGNTGLLVARSSTAVGPHVETCSTRIAPVGSAEQTPLLGGRKQSWTGETAATRHWINLKVRMRYSETGPSYNMPNHFSWLRRYTWQFVVALLQVLQIVYPLLFLIVNKPCPSSSHSDSAHSEFAEEGN